MTGLESHNQRVKYDLEILGIGGPTWVKPQKGVYDAIIIGGGQSGLGAAFGLMKERITNILILDENPKGKEGPWITYARMITLRTPKELLSIEMGVPSLSFRAWWVSQYGEVSWEAIEKIPREDWMAYLRWYREILSLPVQNNSKLTRIKPTGQGLHELDVTTPDGEQRLIARKVILATGIQGGGEWHTPKFIRDALPKSRYAHTSEDVDYEALKGKRIGILGGGASAFDNAQHALGLGAQKVDVFMRRKEIPQVNPIRFMEQTGVVPRFAELNDPLKYRVISSFFNRNQPPTNDTFQRACAWPEFGLQLGSPWKSLKETPEGVEVTTPKGVFTYDFLVLSTGILTDVFLRPELGDFAGKIATWSDVYEAPDTEKNKLLDIHPYLGEHFEYTPKRPDDAAVLHGLFAFNYSALVSLGLSASALTGLPYALPRLAKGVADQLFLDNKEEWIEDYLAYDEPEFVGSEAYKVIA